MILHTFVGDSSATKVLVCARFAGVKVTLNLVKLNDLRTKEFKKKMQLGRLPILDIDSENSIGQSSAMIRHIGRTKEECYGANPYQKSLTDQWLEVEESRLSPASLALVAPLQGVLKADKAAQKAATEDIYGGCSALENQLSSTPFLTGDKPTIADYTVFTTLAQCLICAIPINAMNKFPAVKKWIDVMSADPHVTSCLGKLSFCTKPWVAPPEEQDA